MNGNQQGPCNCAGCGECRDRENAQVGVSLAIPNKDFETWPTLGFARLTPTDRNR